MSYPKLVAAALLIGTLAAGGVALAGPENVKAGLSSLQLAAGEKAEHGDSFEGPVLDMKDILEQLAAKGYGEVREIEREGAHYEVKARDGEGRWRELTLDARDGKLLSDEEDD